MSWAQLQPQLVHELFWLIGFFVAFFYINNPAFCETNSSGKTLDTRQKNFISEWTLSENTKMVQLHKSCICILSWSGKTDVMSTHKTTPLEIFRPEWSFRKKIWHLTESWPRTEVWKKGKKQSPQPNCWVENILTWSKFWS